jgi:hypothetical protein
MIATHYIPPNAKVCKTIHGNRRIRKLPHLTWDDSTTPPPPPTPPHRRYGV